MVYAPGTAAWLAQGLVSLRRDRRDARRVDTQIDGHQRGDEQYQYRCRNHDADAERRGEGDQELRLNGPFENEGRETEEGGKRGQGDGAKTRLGAFDDGRFRGAPSLSRWSTKSIMTSESLTTTLRPNGMMAITMNGLA